ncbi:MAG: M20/M25/M40 family metallo-hydrolase [Gemmatimonadetes bacterium]|nr:M20/M25/M40 family metallo-hydrolase [Gemmatimonadota bacterium]
MKCIVVLLLRASHPRGAAPAWRSGCFRLGTTILVAFVLAALTLSPTGAHAQRVGLGDADIEALASWLGPDVVTGYETRLTPRLAEAMPGWRADRWGNLVRVIGGGAPRRILACALDRPALSASQITDDGYLRVHRIGRGSRHPLWDQAFEAQQVRILTPSGPVAGVVARSNGHFAQQHRDETDVVSADDLWVDVGASSRAEVRALGIGLLDPVVRHLPPWTLDGAVAGPGAGGRAGCAVVAALAQAADDGAAGVGETHFVLSAQEGFGWVGLSSYVARNGEFDGLAIVSPGAISRVDADRPAGDFGRLEPILEGAGLEAATWLAPAVRSPGAHMEVLANGEAVWLLRAAAAAADVEVGPDLEWVGAPTPAPLRDSHFDPTLGPVADVLTDLVELYGVPGHEWSVRRYVLDNLPDWAKERAVVDDIGNVWVAAGPDRDSTVFMAHLDEVGYEVQSIAQDGTVTLDRLGGAVSSAWEGQTALLHFDPPGAPSTARADGRDASPAWKEHSLQATRPREPLRGVFLTRDVAEQKNPPPERAWFGLDRSELEALGVQAGMQVTSNKEGLRMGHSRFVARALDDRAGTTALLTAIQALDPDELTSKVIFAWSVHEEGGLVGAGAMARRFGASARRIYSVDTFVSSDTPLESPHFAHAPLGAGPVLRATENSGVSPDGERARVFRAASTAGIPLQMGLTQGGTDGTTFTFWGAPNQGLSWPGRYSHSPGEVLDLRDLLRLRDLILAVATLDSP